MHRHSILLTIALTGSAGLAHAQGGIQLSDVAGTWVTKSMVGPKDSVVVRNQVVATADPNGWRMKFARRTAIPVRVVASGGDSVVTEAGPFPSVLRAGQTVSLLHVVGHYKGDTMTGTFEARYASGDVLRGKLTATRTK